ncbi:MAG: hypothetical protein U0929_17300 [Planctomycetaceae bacterium]
MQTLNQKGWFVVISPVVIVYAAMLIALSPPPPPVTSLTVQEGATIRIENAQLGKVDSDGESLGSWLFKSLVPSALATFGVIFAACKAAAISKSVADSQEKRLRVETFNKSAELMKNTNGSTASGIEGSALVFSLMKLEEYEFALEMVHILWSKGQISSAAAVWTIDKIFELRPVEKYQSLQEYAANALWIHAKKLPNSDCGFDWPPSFDWKWNNELSEFCRRYVLRATADLLVSKGRKEWRKHWIDSLLYKIDFARKGDSLPANRYRAALIQKGILDTYDKDHAPRFIQFGNNSKSFDELKKEVETTLEIESEAVAEIKSDQHFDEAIQHMVPEKWPAGPLA